MRSDWEDVKVKAMRLTLLAKSRAAHIVEESVHAAWWGAKPVGRDRLSKAKTCWAACWWSCATERSRQAPDRHSGWAGMKCAGRRCRSNSATAQRNGDERKAQRPHRAGAAAGRHRRSRRADTPRAPDGEGAVLFESRARGDHRPDSEWDIALIVGDERTLGH